MPTCMPRPSSLAGPEKGALRPRVMSVAGTPGSGAVCADLRAATVPGGTCRGTCAGRRDGGIDGLRVGDRSMAMGVHELGDAIGTLKGILSGQKAVIGGPQRVYVATAIHRPGLTLLGAHEERRADDHAGLGEVAA